MECSSRTRSGRLNAARIVFATVLTTGLLSALPGRAQFFNAAPARSARDVVAEVRLYRLLYHLHLTRLQLQGMLPDLNRLQDSETVLRRQQDDAARAELPRLERERSRLQLGLQPIPEDEREIRQMFSSLRPAEIQAAQLRHQIILGLRERLTPLQLQILRDASNHDTGDGSLSAIMDEGDTTVGAALLPGLPGPPPGAPPDPRLQRPPDVFADAQNTATDFINSVMPPGMFSQAAPVHAGPRAGKTPPLAPAPVVVPVVDDETIAAVFLRADALPVLVNLSAR